MEMKTWAMLTDGVRPWESAGGYSPLLWLKAFVCPLSPQPAMQGSCLAAAAAQSVTACSPSCSTSLPASAGYVDQGGQFSAPRLGCLPSAPSSHGVHWDTQGQPATFLLPGALGGAAPSHAQAVLPRDHIVLLWEGSSIVVG